MASSRASAVRSALVSVDYEVFGRVQGVFFRKYTKRTADSYGLVGWVFNTENKTVTGVVQGNRDKIKSMKDWLQYEGSPYSTIKKAVFSNEKDIAELGYKKFSVTGGWKTWLKTKGSPKSRIDKCVFKNERDIEKKEFDGFTIKK